MTSEEIRLTRSGYSDQLVQQVVACSRWMFWWWVVAADISDDKLAAAKECGGDVLIDVRRGERRPRCALTDGRGVDAAIDFVASRETLEGCMASLARTGRLVIIGSQSLAVFGVDARFTVEPGRMLNDMLEIHARSTSAWPRSSRLSNCSVSNGSARS